MLCHSTRARLCAFRQKPTTLLDSSAPSVALSFVIRGKDCAVKNTCFVVVAPQRKEEQSRKGCTIVAVQVPFETV
uniref:Uncharacterized protein n=1 Tax=Lutzomyia longipalpis TaxID=7200 RepID=A0A1B0CQH1_LUTLO